MTAEDVEGYLSITARVIYRIAADKKNSTFNVHGILYRWRRNIDAWIKVQSTVKGSGTADNQV